MIGTVGRRERQTERQTEGKGNPCCQRDLILNKNLSNICGVLWFSSMCSLMCERITPAFDTWPVSLRERVVVDAFDE